MEQQEQLRQLIEHMQDQTRRDMQASGQYEQYGETGIRVAVYEDLRDQLKSLFADIAYL